MKLNVNITRDRELVDMLYNSYVQLSELQADLTSLEQQHAELAVAHLHHEHEQAQEHGLMQKPKQQSEQSKTLERAIKKNVELQKNMVQIIKLLIQNHTDATSIINEFEKIRTSCILQSVPFAIGHVMPMVETHK
jgi:hypothetical protein